MASIIYMASENGLAHRFLALIEKAIPKKKFHICRSVEELSVRLRRPRSNIRVAVLFSVTQTEVMQIVSLGDLMADVKTILILAEDDGETIMKAHILRPRYVTWVDTDFRYIVRVLRNMVDLYDVPPGSARNQQCMSSMKARPHAMG